MAKLTKEQKIEMFEQRLKGETLKNLSLKFNLNESKIKYLIALICTLSSIISL